MSEPMKTCTKCGETFPATTEWFLRHKGGKFGLHGQRKTCLREQARKRHAENPKENTEKTREAARKRYAKNPEKTRARARKNYAKNPEKARENARKWHKKNPEKANEYERKRRAENPEKVRKSARKWQTENPEKINEYERKRRALLHELPFNFPPWMKQRALDYFHNCCAVCGRQLEDLFDGHKAALNHWIAIKDPRPDNPGTVSTNMIPLCDGTDGCSNSKNKNDPYKWVNQKYSDHEAREIINRVDTYIEWVRNEDA